MNLSAATTGLLGSGPALKRKIPLNKITGMTLSNMSTEFVIHVPDEYDYRYSQFELRNDIIATIID
jgi:serum/glucocorticoid-regulated kinase 2